MIFSPRHFAGILAEMRAEWRYRAMLTNLSRVAPGRYSFRPGSCRRHLCFVGFPLIDQLHFKGRMKIVRKLSPRRHGQFCLWRRDDE